MVAASVAGSVVLFVVLGVGTAGAMTAQQPNYTVLCEARNDIYI
jgi:hypothetical protein